MTVSNPNAPAPEERPPLKVVGYDSSSIAASASNPGVVDVRLKLSREPTDYEVEQAVGSGYVFDLGSDWPFVQLEDVEVDKLPDWIAKVNDQLSVLDSDAAYAERRVLTTIEAAQRVLAQVDFES